MGRPHRTRHIRRTALLAVTMLLLAACGGDDAADDTAAATTAPPATEEAAATATAPADTTTEAQDDATAADDTAAEDDMAAGATVATTSTPLGEFVVDGEGRTLYLLTADSPGETTCTDACAGAWPPFTTDDGVTAGEGADDSLLGTIERPDGTTQVTYGDWPLYYFQNDAEPGDVTGQGIESFGGIWWVVTPDGEALEEEQSASADGALGY